MATPAGVERYHLPIGTPLGNAEAAKLWGKGKAALSAINPWPEKGGKIEDVKKFGKVQYDRPGLAKALLEREKHTIEFDPRRIDYASQPGITKAGVEHYMDHPDEPFSGAGAKKPGNIDPVIFHDLDTGKNTILSGHHRATAALLSGRTMRAVYYEGHITPNDSAKPKPAVLPPAEGVFDKGHAAFEAAKAKLAAADAAKAKQAAFDKRRMASATRRAKEDLAARREAAKLVVKGVKGGLTKDAAQAAAKKAIAKKVNARAIAWRAKHSPSAANIDNVWNEATPEEVTGGLNWYANAHKVAEGLAQRYHMSTNQAAGLLAVYSPQTNWGWNLQRAGRVMASGKGIGGKGSGVMATDLQRQMADRILAGERWQDVLGPTSWKVRAFAKLIEEGDTPDTEHDVVIDRHALSVAVGERAGVAEYRVFGTASAKRTYDAVAGEYEKQAAKLTKTLGRPVSGHQVQAVTWLTRQRLNGEEDKALSANGLAKSSTKSSMAWKDWTDWAKANAPELLQWTPPVGVTTTDLANVAEDVELAKPQATFGAKYRAKHRKPDAELVADLMVALRNQNAKYRVQVALAGTVSPTAAAAAFGITGRGTAARPNARLKGSKSTRAIKKVRDSELNYRAEYLLNAARRIQASLDAGQSIKQAIRTEGGNQRLHEKARRQRLDAVRETEHASKLYGNLLGWYLNPLLNNDSECIAANGNNFYAGLGTVIGYPGSVHPNCGCKAGPPFPPPAVLVNEAIAAHPDVLKGHKMAPKTLRRIA